MLESTGAEAAIDAIASDNATAPARMANGRNGIGGDDGTSQGSNDDRDSMQLARPYDGYLRHRLDDVSLAYPMPFRHKGPRKTKNAPAAIKAKPIA